MLERLAAAAVLIPATAALAAQPGVSFELGRDASASAQSAIVAGDFNHDGKPDWIACCSGNSLELHLGNGDGTFQPPLPAVAAPAPIQALAAADLNRDGNLDLVGVAASGGQGFLYVWFGNGNGTFRPPLSYPTTSPALSVTLGDFFANGFTDIATGNQDGTVEIFRNEGETGFVEAKSLRLGGLGGSAAITRIASGNIGASGADDLTAVAGRGVAWLLWNDGHGGFTPDRLGGYVDPVVSLSDMNGDGLADVLVAYTCRPTPVSGPQPGPQYQPCAGFDIFYGQRGNRTVQQTVVTDPGVYDPGAFHAGSISRQVLWGIDLNGDGYQDLVAITSLAGWHDFGLLVWMGHPDGTFDQTPTPFIASASAAGQGIAEDFNRDGRMDFAMTNPQDGHAALFLNATQQAACGKYTSGPSVTVCQPVEHSFVPSPVHLQAHAVSPKSLTALQEYVDGKLLLSQSSGHLDKSFPVPPGEHLFATKAWDAAGGSVEVDRRVTVFQGSPGPVCSEGICLPDPASSAAPVRILANGYTAALPTAAQLYVNGQLVVNERGPCQAGQCSGGVSSVDAQVKLAPGSNTVVFKLWDVNGKVYTAQRVITAQ